MRIAIVESFANAFEHFFGGDLLACRHFVADVHEAAPVLRHLCAVGGALCMSIAR